MESVIDVSGRAPDELKELAKRVALKSLENMKQKRGLEVVIRFVSEKEIQKINLEFRNIDRVTDVLSFPSTSTCVGEIFDLTSDEAQMLKTENGLIHFGDMAICLKKLKLQAKEYGVTLEQELKKIVIHSMLHLMGYDHIKDEDYAIMSEKEKYLDKKISI